MDSTGGSSADAVLVLTKGKGGKQQLCLCALVVDMAGKAYLTCMITAGPMLL